MESIQIKITESILKKVDPSINRISDTDISGFHARLGKADIQGKRTTKFYLYYRIGGRKGTSGNYLIGSHGNIDVKAARIEAKQLFSQIARGIDINQAKRKTKLATIDEKSAPVLNSLLDDFEKHAEQQRKRPEEVSRAFRADVRPTIGNIKLKELSRLTIIQKCLDPIKKRGASVQANKTLSLLKQTLQFGVERGLLENNPLSGTRRVNIGGKEQPRNRFLSLAEIEYFFNWLKTSTASIQVKQSFKLLLLTGCRAQELTLSQWSDIDWENNIWLFPESNRKGNKGETKDHIVPLTDAMKECLSILQQAHKDLHSEYIFPSTTGQVGQKPVDRAVCAKFLRRRFDGEQPELDMESFVPHDLRRSFQTHLSKLGVDAIVCEKLLSHELQGMLRVYNQNDYMDERKKALELWSETIWEFMK